MKKFKINVRNNDNHICNPLNRFANSECVYDSWKEACEDIYSALFDIINSELGCEMIDRAEAGMSADYDDICHAYICDHGYATEDGVTASVEEIEEEK